MKAHCSVLVHQSAKNSELDNEKQSAVMRAMFHHLVGETVQRVSPIMIFADKVDGKINEKRNHLCIVLFGSDFDPRKCTLVIEQQDVSPLGNQPRFAVFYP